MLEFELDCWLQANGKLLEEAVADFEAALLVLEETDMLETEMGARVFQDLSIAQAGWPLADLIRCVGDDVWC